MLNIKVLGPGCANCQKVEAVAREAVVQLGVEATIEHVTQRADIASYHILATPGLVINEKVVAAGRIPNVNEVMGWVGNASQGAR